MWSMFLLIILTLCAGFVGWLFFLWAVKSGQYDDIEGPKYRMLDDEEDAKRDDREHKDIKKP
jgi:cbb3-type cytochrome oxidase maturation protein